MKTNLTKLKKNHITYTIVLLKPVFWIREGALFVDHKRNKIQKREYIFFNETCY